MLTYGDGVSDVDLARGDGDPPPLRQDRPRSPRCGRRRASAVWRSRTAIVTDFVEKPQIGEGWINGGFMIFEPAVFDHMDDDTDSLEKDVLERLAAERQLGVYAHGGFWQCMDTLRERDPLEELWQRGRAPWKRWD